MIVKIETNKERLAGHITQETYYLRVESINYVHVMGQGQVCIDDVLFNENDPGVQDVVNYFDEASKPKQAQS